MLCLIAIPMFIMSGLPNKTPRPEKPIEPIAQQTAEWNLELCCYSGIRIFHDGRLAHFGLNKTALAPQQEKHSKPDCSTSALENIQAKELPAKQAAKKTCRETTNQPVELVSPLIVNLTF